MGITRIRGLLAISLAALLLAGCASNEPEEPAEVVVPDEPVEVVQPAPEPPKIQRPEISSSGQMIYPIGDETLQGIFYFDFDQAIVKRSGHTELDKHAKGMMLDRTIRVRLEGHADERGTREYNLALGERRANAVRAYLTSQGASRSQIEVISYGEEKPAVMGGGESSWARNRRVEFAYKQ
ncbi:MAG: peptidoglycan-associated lipoprotein Pal [bacterium]|nr:peptidoglycan-associated lipoprotein Pal [Gammaproteobacteria bacterium]